MGPLLARIAGAGAQKLFQGAARSVEGKAAQTVERKLVQSGEEKLQEGVSRRVSAVVTEASEESSQSFMEQMGEVYDRVNQALHRCGRGPLHEEVASETLDKKVMVPMKAKISEETKDLYAKLPYMNRVNNFQAPIFHAIGSSYMNNEQQLRSPMYMAFYAGVNPSLIGGGGSRVQEHD